MWNPDPLHPDIDSIQENVTTLAELVEKRARCHGARRALTFLPDGENEEGHLTYHELDQRARGIAAFLQDEGLVGKTVLLLYPSGLEFVAGFLGCLYAGAVAVPAYPPRLGRHLGRLRSVVTDSQATVALTTAVVYARIQPFIEETGLSALRLIQTESVNTEGGRHWRRPESSRETLAFLQYTSGSTARPKGAMLSHGNLLENLRMIQVASGQSQESRIVSWLPLFHDMGLIGNVLLALYLGTECVFMPPEAFLMRPLRWLAAITRYRGSYSGAPNFAYDFCVKKITVEQRRSLDLGSWESAFVGAEPVRAESLERFAAAFSGCGFRSEAFHPCYGLAEAVVFVAGVGRLAGAMQREFSSPALEKHRVAAGESEKPETRTLVSCGRTWLEQEIVIADPQNGRRCAADEVGEVWVRGPHIARGYWNRPEETERAFGARLQGEKDNRFLRTGDLGFFHDGELFIAGRLKDLIIVAGRNHDPVDIEHTVQASHPAIRSGACAAFQIEISGESRLVIAAELERTARSAGEGAGLEATTIVKAVREAVAEHHDVTVHAVELLKPASLPKTTSGKVQRHACRAEYISDSLHLWFPKTRSQP
jgi:acyl-CoA synthetase (AMP-forming)/AMP-acid ligase II